MFCPGGREEQRLYVYDLLTVDGQLSYVMFDSFRREII